MANFVAKRAVTFLISRGPGFPLLDSIIQLINIWETNCAIQWIEMKNPDMDTISRRLGSQPRSQGSLLPALSRSVGPVGEDPGNEVESL